MGTKKVIIIDAYNMIHRCRFNWGGGMAKDHNMVLYNFVRVIKSTASLLKPDIIYFVLEGKPKDRLEKYSDYKANRIVAKPSDEEVEYFRYFSEQKAEIIGFVKNALPVTTAVHPEMEGDDLIYNIIKYRHPNDECCIVSNDSDFLQVLNEFGENVKIWNPIKSKFAEEPPYDYVSWKAMVGDRSDNIPGVKGVGKVGAGKILKTEGMLEEKLSDDNFSEQYNLSYDLIKFKDLNGEFKDVLFTNGEYNIDDIKLFFTMAGFESLLKDKYINQFEKTFNSLTMEKTI